MFRPPVGLIATLAAVLLAGIGAATLFPGRVASFFSVCVTGVAIASWIIGMAMSIERRGTLSIADGAVRASWLSAPLRPTELFIGRWVQTSLDTPVGLVAHLRGPDGALRIGAREPMRGTYRLDGPRMRLVDCHLPAPEFDALVQLLGVRTVVPPADLEIELVARRRVLRMLAPWIIATGCGSVAGTGLSALGLPQVIITIPILASIMAGIVATALDSWRIREPEHELRIGAQGIALRRLGGGVEAERVPWQGVRAVATTGIMRTKGRTFVYPTTELWLGAGPPILVGAWDSSLAWSDPMTRPRRAPDWLVGSADWPRLVTALSRHGCFR
jgi:hypothetical protein